MTAKNNFRLKFINGQSTIEALAVATALVGFFSVLLVVTYFGFVRVGMSYLLHEHLVCEETEGRSRCRETFVKAARPFLIFAEIQIFESQRRRQKISNRLELRMPFKKTMKFKNELGLYQ